MFSHDSVYVDMSQEISSVRLEFCMRSMHQKKWKKVNFMLDI